MNKDLWETIDWGDGADDADDTNIISHQTQTPSYCANTKFSAAAARLSGSSAAARLSGSSAGSEEHDKSSGTSTPITNDREEAARSEEEKLLGRRRLVQACPTGRRTR